MPGWTDHHAGVLGYSAVTPALQITKAADEAAWMAVLGQIPRYDFYHLPGYHQLATARGEGDGILITYSEGAKLIALPLLLRPVPTAAIDTEHHYQDATSVYGYAGPIASSSAADDVEFVDRFCTALQQWALEIGIVSIFSRFHPILENHRLVDGLGYVRPLGPTISIDLASPPDLQFAEFRKSHRYEIRRARSQEICVHRANDQVALAAFYGLYCATMRRLNAADRYFFDAAYLQRLNGLPGASLQVFLAEQHGQLCAAALFMHTCDIVQYHLSASDPQYANLAPTKLLIDEARLWASEIGARYLHLGGGVSSQEDQLFQMKCGFSALRHRFFVWHWIVNAKVYQELLHEQGYREDSLQAGPSSDFTYFPQYREHSGLH